MLVYGVIVSIGLLEVFISSLRILYSVFDDTHTQLLPDQLSSPPLLHTFNLRVFFFISLNPLSPFVLPKNGHALTYGQPGRGVTQLKNTKSFFPRSYQVLIASWLGVGLHGPLPTSILRFLSGLDLCRSSACCHNHYEFLCATVLVCPENSFLEVICYLLL